MWRVPSERIPLDLGGPFIEVERLTSWSIQYECLHMLNRFMQATKREDEYLALGDLYEHFVAEAQPQWDLVDHRGPIPLTPRGMSRVPLDIALPIVSLWLASLPVAEQAEGEAESREPLPFEVVESPAPSAVDAAIPSGPVNAEVKRRLRAAKRKAA